MVGFLGTTRNEVVSFCISENRETTKVFSTISGLNHPCYVYIYRLSVVEVFDHHISRVIDDWLLLKHLKDDRLIYVVEILGLTGKDDDPLSNNCDSEDGQVSSSSDSKTEPQDKSGKNQGPAILL